MVHREVVERRGGSQRMASLAGRPKRMAKRKPGSPTESKTGRILKRTGSMPASRAQPEYRYWVDVRGRQHFNFRQRIWLDRSVRMAVTPNLSIALETLALNLITTAVMEAGTGMNIEVVNGLTRPFCVECLLTAPSIGWVIPRASIRAWIGSHLPRAWEE